MSNLAFVNIASWAPDQVGNWLKGLDDNIVPYANEFVEARVTGKRLLCLGYHDLLQLKVNKLGHQEMILEAADMLCALHHMMETETLQSISLKLECKARSLHNEVKAITLSAPTDDVTTKLPVSILSAAADTVASIKTLVSWLDRSPFEGGAEYVPIKNKIMQLGSELLQAAQGDDISACEQDIMDVCLRVTEVSNRLVQESRDPIILQPTTIELATIHKKPDEELGMHIQSSHSGTHTIGKIKDDSPADRCGKVEEGDEVIQVNYQTVVGWQLKKLVAALKANEKEVTLTLKKRPHHVNPFGVSPKKRKVPKNLKQSTFPKAMSRRKSKEDKGGSRHLKDCFINSVPAATQAFSESAQELENEGDTDNEIDNDVFQTVGTLPVVQIEPKQRRATVSGGSPTVTRPAITICDVSPPQRPKSHIIGNSMSSDSSAVSMTSPINELLFSPHLLSPETKRDAPAPEPVLVPEASGSFTPKPGDTQQQKSDSPLQKKTESPSQKTSLSSPRSTESGLHRAASSPLKSTSPQKTEISTSFNAQTTPKKDEMTPPKTESSPRKSDTTSPKPDRSEPTTTHKTELKIPFGLSGMSGNTTPPNPKTTANRRARSSESAALEVAGGSDVNSPTLLRVRRLDSSRRSDTSSSPDESPPSLLRKKHLMRRIGANRRISCKDLGHGECQGWLYKKTEGSGFRSSKWTKRWFVLKQQNLYYYKDQEDLKAKGVIHLPGFQVSPANEIRSKKFAFKAHHSGTTFFFASERQDDMAKWMNKMGLAAIVYNTDNLLTTAGFSRPESPTTSTHSEHAGYYSESDDEDKSQSNSPVQPRRSPPAVSELSDREGLVTKESLSNLYRTIQSADLGIDGSDVKNRRQSAMATSKQLQIEKREDLEKGRHLTSLQRTLKDRQRELELIDDLLKKTSLDSSTLKSFKQQHPDVVNHMKGRPELAESHSDDSS